MGINQTNRSEVVGFPFQIYRFFTHINLYGLDTKEFTSRYVIVPDGRHVERSDAVDVLCVYVGSFGFQVEDNTLLLLLRSIGNGLFEMRDRRGGGKNRKRVTYMYRSYYSKSQVLMMIIIMISNI